MKRYRDLVKELFEEAAATSDDAILESGVEDFPLPRKLAKAAENVVRYAERNPQRLPKVGKYVGRAFKKGASKVGRRSQGKLSNTCESGLVLLYCIVLY